MAKIYWIGGSPCSGKSTIAEIIANRYGLYYFKVDDYLEKYTNYGFLLNLEICRKQSIMNSEEIWMREAALQYKEELQFYDEIFDFILQDLETMCEGRDIITEGTAYLPNLINERDIPRDRYLAITPTRNFQINHYIQREWIYFVLDGCSDFQKAFNNWMDRDCLFAEEVIRQCGKNRYLSLVNDGKTSIKDLVEMVSAHFSLDV